MVNISDIGVPEITCHFLNGPVSSASCEISYGTNENYMNLSNSTSASDTNTTAVTLQLAQLQSNTEYYYIVLAIGDSMQARIRGSFITGMYPLHASLLKTYKFHFVALFSASSVNKSHTPNVTVSEPHSGSSHNSSVSKPDSCNSHHE